MTLPDAPGDMPDDMVADMVEVGTEALHERCVYALRAAGAGVEASDLLATATVEAEVHGRPALGVAHLVDYLDGYRSGRIAADATPVLEERSAVLASVQCAGGPAQHGFERALPWLGRACLAHGVAVACVSEAFTAGELAYYVRRLTDRGLVGLVVANSPALMAVLGSRDPVVGTNPLAFGVPLGDGDALVIDQAASASAWVSIREAAATGAPIPAGYAVDAAGEPTTSAEAALAGALLPFGGYKGGNVALVVELLAVLAGGHFSCEAPPFDRGSESPSVGLFVLALSPGHLRPGYEALVRDQLRHWADVHGADTARLTSTERPATVTVPRAALATLD